MALFKLSHGAAEPLRITGTNCVRLALFAWTHKGWHTAKQDRPTKRAIDTLKRLGCLEVVGWQFRWKYPKEK